MPVSKGGEGVKTAVQFGAGNIGRGFMAQLFWEAGYRTVFIETSPALVSLLNERDSYTLRLLDGYTREAKDLQIGRFEGVAAQDEGAVAERIASADTAATAVGVRNLEGIASAVARGLVLRMEKNPRPIDFYLCENILDAASILKKAVDGLLSSSQREWCDLNAGFVGTSVARMVPSAEKGRDPVDPLFVAADSYHKLPYDGRASRAPRPPIEGLYPVSNFRAEVERKLFTHNLGHATLSYLGFLKGHGYIHEALDDSELAGFFDRVLEETSQALCRRYPEDLDPEEHSQIREDVKVRFGNPLIRDTVERVAKDPVRKLGPADRLVGSARLCMEQGVFPENIAYVCAAAFHYSAPSDPIAGALQRNIREKGIEKVLWEVSHVDPSEKLGREIVKNYSSIAEKMGGKGM